MLKNKTTGRFNARRIGLLSIVALLFAAVCGGAVYGYWTVFEHRFATVTEGKVYRSGAMPPEQLVKKILLRFESGMIRQMLLSSVAGEPGLPQQ